MKTRQFFFISMLLIAFSSCSAELIDPVGGSVEKCILETEYSALKTTNVDFDADALPAITISEAENILKSLRLHKNVKEEFRAETRDEGDAHVWELLMKQIIDNKYTFAIQLHITSYDDGSLFYNGYKADCSVNKILWRVGGFSFESDKTTTSDFKFNSSSNLFFKVASESGKVEFFKVPVAISGVYHSDSQTSSYIYSI